MRPARRISWKADRPASQFDHLFKGGETFRIGEVEAKAMLVTGHTPADMGYLIEDSVFVGDTCSCLTLGLRALIFPAATQ